MWTLGQPAFFLYLEIVENGCGLTCSLKGCNSNQKRLHSLALHGKTSSPIKISAGFWRGPCNNMMILYVVKAMERLLTPSCKLGCSRSLWRASWLGRPCTLLFWADCTIAQCHWLVYVMTFFFLLLNGSHGKLPQFLTTLTFEANLTEARLGWHLWDWPWHLLPRKGSRDGFLGERLSRANWWLRDMQAKILDLPTYQQASV